MSIKEILSNSFNIKKEVVVPPLVQKEILSNSFNININKIINTPPEITNIQVLNTNILGDYELKFNLSDVDNDSLYIYLKINSNDYTTILTQQTNGTIIYKGVNMPNGTNVCRLKASDGKSECVSEEFKVIIPDIVEDDVFESIELITDKNLKAGEYNRIAIRLKSKANINNIKLNPKLSLPSGTILKNVQWEKGNILTDYRPSVGEISTKTSELKIGLDGIVGSVEKIEKDYVTKGELDLSSENLQIKFSQSGGYNLVYNGDFKRQFECWEPNSSYWLYGDRMSSPNGRGIYCDGALNSSRTVYLKGDINLDARADAYTLSYWINTSATGSDGTTNPYRRAELTIYYKDGSTSWHSVENQTKYDVWEKHVITVTRPANKEFSHFNLGLWCRDTTKRVHYSMVMIEKGTMATEWRPNPNEVYDGITTIDRDGIKVKQSNISTYTEMDASSFRVSDNNGGTVAEFSKASTIPNLTAGIITANEIYAGNVCSKSPKAGDIKFIYVNGSTGNDNNAGTSSSPYKTVQRAIDDIKDKQDQSVTIYVYNSVPGFDLKGVTGTGVITLSLQDSAVINGYVILGGVTNCIRITNETGSLKATFKNGISIFRCVNVDIYGVTFRGTNAQGNNIYIQDTNYCAVNSCDLGGLSSQLLCAIRVQSSLLWLHGCKGSNITDVVGQYAFSHVMMARGGTSNVPDYSNTLLCNYDGAGRIQNWTGGTFTKTPSSGWNPAYTPTQKTQTWNFNKVWSDETLNGWSNRQELIQGYASTWNTGRWTGYMQFTDDMAAIRSAISGGTNFSGRLYVQRRTSSGNSTGSKLCLYASDGTLITNSTTINRGQGVWVNLSSAIISKIASGAITYFYLKADANNTSTYFKCEANPKIEITYTK